MGTNVILNPNNLAAFLEMQLSSWPLAKRNFNAFKNIKRRTIEIGDYPVSIQYNPARIVSTAAKVTDGKVSERPCFLCENNRPLEQLKLSILPGWDLLINPYPIFPMHFTIVSTKHQPQSAIPFEIVEIAEKMPGMVVFFNGASAGASAPDHLHLQAVLADELPLLKRVETLLPSSETGFYSSQDIDTDFPFIYFTGIITHDEKSISFLSAALKTGGPSPDGLFNDLAKVNSFFWIDKQGVLRFLSIPRKSHRPSCFFTTDYAHRLISPGCIDMAGVLITPREEDFNRLNVDEIIKIYSEVAVTS